MINFHRSILLRILHARRFWTRVWSSYLRVKLSLSFLWLGRKIKWFDLLIFTDNLFDFIQISRLWSSLTLFRITSSCLISECEYYALVSSANNDEVACFKVPWRSFTYKIKKKVDPKWIRVELRILLHKTQSKYLWFGQFFYGLINNFWSIVKRHLEHHVHNVLILKIKFVGVTYQKL